MGPEDLSTMTREQIIAALETSRTQADKYFKSFVNAIVETKALRARVAELECQNELLLLRVVEAERQGVAGSTTCSEESAARERGE